MAALFKNLTNNVYKTIFEDIDSKLILPVD